MTHTLRLFILGMSTGAVVGEMFEAILSADNAGVIFFMVLTIGWILAAWTCPADEAI